uniref:NADH-ubiquinone oxidoreductase chain 5 n=1 Tax=Eupristina koningsbergeri TaxID=318089 RepID=A0A8A3YE51_9HYME|nr:NADH dehydrogenase subunit 5 [Eupristina koningsbergeri]
MYLYYLSSFIFFIISINSFIMSLIFLYFKNSMFFEWSVMSLNSVSINMYLFFDWMTFMFIFVVMLISSMIMMYCNEYMSSDSNKVRFFYLVFFFVLSMLLMIVSPNMVSILIGWDGLGLISYMLVIYYNSVSSYKSGMLTVLMNRVGDVFILITISMMMIYGSWNYMNYNFMNWMILLFIMIAAFTKSAQFPFSSWLPAAMAAPTPVSSLVHSSTLVTAGIYLLVRFQYLFDNNDELLYYISVTGLITMMMAGILAIFEYDLKKIIAYSTLSQLGMMMMTYGIKSYDLVFFHLIIHAIFKSMMFMCSGVIIHNMNNSQDIRFMGNIKDMMPLTFMIMMVSSYSLCGVPFMSGFYSKDKILEVSLLSNLPMLNKMMLLFSIMLTVMYSFRMSSFLSVKVNMSLPYKFCSDSKIMNMSMLILLFMSLMFGMFMKWLLFMNVEIMFMNMYDKFWFYFILFISVISGKLLWMFSFNLPNMLKLFLSKMWLSNILVNKIIFYPLFFGKQFIYLYEKGWSEYFLNNMMMDYSLLLKKVDLLNNNNVIIMLMAIYIYMIMLLVF